MALLERTVMLGGSRVPYLYGTDRTAELADAVAAAVADAPAILLVVDRHALPHADGFEKRLAGASRVERFVMDATEPHKTLTSVQAILEFAVERRISRGSVMIAMGGGLVGNVAGLAAALLYRGTRLVHLPTTPVAAFDSVLSAKQGVNLSGGKNLCGTYYPPALIACDLAWLASVPRRQMLTGLAEMAKNVLIAVPALEDTFVHAVKALGDRPAEGLASLFEIGFTAKAPLLEIDPRERREALIFEYGHTVGHALEFTSRGAMSHGEAVAWGMLVAATVSRLAYGMSDAELDRHRWLVSLLELPSPAERLGGVDLAEVRAVLAMDNKRGYVRCGPAEFPMVLLAPDGRPLVDDNRYPLVPVPEDVVFAALRSVAGL
jgi:3-dehydroquinate synthase/2-deoxy-scyllo-inosose synthase